MQVSEAAMLRDSGGSCRVVETGQTGMMTWSVTVVEVRKTSIWLERGGVLWRSIHSVGVWVGIKARTSVGTGVCILSCRIRIGEHHLPWIPTLLALLAVHVLLQVS